MASGTCIPGAIYSFNLFSGATCGTNAATISSFPYVNLSSGALGDYHLTGSTIASEFVIATTIDASLATDYDGQLRNVPRDAGSDESDLFPPLLGNLFVTQNGSDANLCTQNAPCLTFNRAYQIANCGNIINVAPGNYPSQTIRELVTLSSCINNVIINATGVIINGGISLGDNNAGTGPANPDTNSPDHLTIRGLTYSGNIVMWGDATFITIENVSGGSVLIQGAQDITIRNSEFGPCPSTGGSCGRFFILDGFGEGEPTRTSRILVENNTIHDYTITAAADHWECVFTTGGTDVTIRGNRIYNCDTYDLVMGDNGASAGFVRWIIENNWFGDTCCFGGMRTTGGSSRESAVNLYALTDAVIRFNSFAPGQKITNEGGGSVSNVRIIGNIIGASGACAVGATYSFNLFTTGTGCGTSRATISVPYVNPSSASAMNYHLLAGTQAEGWVTGTDSDYLLDVDFDGESRTEPRDAGSDER